MNYKQMAIDCGLPDFNNENCVECFLDIEQLEAFAKAILASGQEPVAKIVTNGSDVFITTPKGTHFSMVDYIGCELYLHPSQDKIDAERLATIEECAKLCDEADKSMHPSDLADKIRAMANEVKE